MSSIREMRQRINSVKNITQVTRALQTVSASKVRKTTLATEQTRPYAESALDILHDLAGQPGHNSLHPLLAERTNIKNALVVLVSSDRGLAGAFNLNIVKYALNYFGQFKIPVSYVTAGRKGRDMLYRRKMKIVADFPQIPSPPTFLDCAPIGKLIVENYLDEECDQVYLVYNRYVNMMKQIPTIELLLPLTLPPSEETKESKTKAVFTYEPDQSLVLESIVPRFTALQVYQAILSSHASEHAARMMAMRAATDNGNDLIRSLQLDYNKARQQIITADMLDIVGGVEGLAKQS
ncbi:MAG: ATP synthase F1 subunit gamma [Anaerolineaceae bacterium]|nr:ATP synthase F1 subunit gamma [Anaerolineaceae bacterium]